MVGFGQGRLSELARAREASLVALESASVVASGAGLWSLVGLARAVSGVGWVCKQGRPSGVESQLEL